MTSTSTQSPISVNMPDLSSLKGSFYLPPFYLVTLSMCEHHSYLSFSGQIIILKLVRNDVTTDVKMLVNDDGTLSEVQGIEELEPSASTQVAKQLRLFLYRLVPLL